MTKRDHKRKAGCVLKSAASRVALPLALAAAIIPTAQASAQIQYSVSFTHRFGSSVTVTGGSNSALAGISEITLGDVNPSGIGAASGTANRTYDDGFSLLDPGTNNAEAVGGAGQTWNWGYNAAAQVNSGTKVLSLSKAGGYRGTYSSVATLADEKDDNLAHNGVYLSAGSKLASFGGVKVSWKAGIGFLDSDRCEFSFSNFAADYATYSYVVVDTYNLSGLTSIPGAPYAGTYDGPGPVISNTPSSRSVTKVSGTGAWTSANQVRIKVDNEITDLFLALPVELVSTGRISFGVEPSLHLLHANIMIDRHESYRSGKNGVTDTWDQNVKTPELLLGAGLDAFVRVDVSQSVFVTLSGGFSKVFGTKTETLGPNDVKLDLDAWQASIGIGWSH